MRQHFLTIFLPVCLLITFLTAIPLPVHAAVVVLKNGDRISGLIVKMKYKRLKIDPSFLDIIKKTSKAYGNFRTERTSITFLDLVRTRQTG